MDLRRAVTVRAKTAVGLVGRPMQRGARTVHMVPEQGVGFGNYLYLLFDAYRRQQRGEDYRVRATRTMRPWLEQLPEMATDLTASPRMIDRREPWRFRLAASFGEDFTREDLHGFLERYLQPVVGETGDAVLNVRRGDFYSDPYVNAAHGMNVPGYVSEALDHVGQVPRLQIVSDDLDWCLDNLREIVVAHTGWAKFKERTPWEGFCVAANASVLVGTNSTFSYWAGYVASWAHDAEVVVPWFTARRPEGWAADQIDPKWTVIRDIPGGWESTGV